MARKRIDSPEAHDGAIDRHPGMIPMPRYRQQPKLEIVVTQAPAPVVPVGPLPEDDDRQAICDSVLAERQAARERAKGWLDISIARTRGYGRAQREHLQCRMVTILADLYRSQPAIMAQYADDRQDIEDLAASSDWTDMGLSAQYLRRHPEQRRHLTEAACRQVVSHA